MPAFDLNVERVVEHWTPAHATREVIANALDEAALSRTAEPQISKADDGVWHVRDFGRGLRHEHLTQNENTEKLAHPDVVVGKFGIGLKDALAVFDRKKIRVGIRSAHGDMTLARLPKHGFEDLTTLHVIWVSHDGAHWTGLALSGASAAVLAGAVAPFLMRDGVLFSGDQGSWFGTAAK